MNQTKNRTMDTGGDIEEALIEKEEERNGEYTLDEMEQQWVNHEWLFTKQSILHSFYYVILFFQLSMFYLCWRGGKRSPYYGLIDAHDFTIFTIRSSLVFLLGGAVGGVLIPLMGKRGSLKCSLFLGAICEAYTTLCIDHEYSFFSMQFLTLFFYGFPMTMGITHLVHEDYWFHGRRNLKTFLKVSPCILFAILLSTVNILVAKNILRAFTWQHLYAFHSGLAFLYVAVIVPEMFESPLPEVQGREYEKLTMNALREFARESGLLLPHDLARVNKTKDSKNIRMVYIFITTLVMCALLISLLRLS